MKKKKKDRSKVFGVVALVVFLVATGLVITGFSVTVSDIDKVAISRTPEAILASAGVSEEKGLLLPVAYFDQRADECVDLYDPSLGDALEKRQFEWTECGYYNKEIETGLVRYELSNNYYPIAEGGTLMPNRGITDFKRWHDEVDGKSASFTGNLRLEYKSEGVEFAFRKTEFYPLDEVDFSDGDFVNKDGHNHLFTMNLAAPFTALLSGDEEFEITADDDTFVFVGKKLVIDMGGIHDATTGKFTINKEGEIYASVDGKDMAYTGVTVENKETSIIRIYHADRDSSSSTFNLIFRGMKLSVMESKLADNGSEEGVQVAYDPTDPTYVAPLGESTTVRPDNTRGYIVLATMEGLMIIIFSVMLAAAIRSVVKRKLQK